jgi:uncharacterized protein (DUF58 family)
MILFFALVQGEFALALSSAGVLLVGFASAVWAGFASARIDLRVQANRERLFPGDALDLGIEIGNRMALPVWVTLEMPSPRLLEAEDSGGGGSVLRSGLGLFPREKKKRLWRLTAARRGVSALGPARISAGDILGLSSRTKNYAAPGGIIVFPRRRALKALSVPFQEYFGMHAARGPVEDPAWYAGTREYSGTRPAKNIHWKASARLGVLQEKIYEPTLRRKVLFILDAAGYASFWAKENQTPFSPDPGCDAPDFPSAGRDFEVMLETLGSLAAALMERGASFGLVSGAPLCGSNRRVLRAGGGPEHLGGFLEILARVESVEKFPPGFAVDAARRRLFLEDLHGAARGCGGFVYCGASPDAGAREVLREAGGRGKVFFVFSRAAENLEGFAGGGLSSWEGRPACLAEDMCRAEGEA